MIIKKIKNPTYYLLDYSILTLLSKIFFRLASTFRGSQIITYIKQVREKEKKRHTKLIVI